jgi:uncharacterized protein YdeI (YjbR/CyaY-like superfamily)
MNTENTLYVSERKDWRAWLAKHHKTDSEIWLVYYRKETGKPRISYNDAVEEALCYGWIDNTVHKLDDERFAQRFSPRKKTSSLSQSNLERIRKLIRQKKMTADGLAAIAHVYNPEKDKQEELVIPPGHSETLAGKQTGLGKFPAVSGELPEDPHCLYRIA